MLHLFKNFTTLKLSNMVVGGERQGWSIDFVEVNAPLVNAPPLVQSVNASFSLD